MRLEDQERSSNVEDRRGMSVGRGVAGGGIGIVVIALVAMLFGVDPSVILNSGLVSGPGQQAPQQQRDTSNAYVDGRARELVALGRARRTRVDQSITR